MANGSLHYLEVIQVTIMNRWLVSLSKQTLLQDKTMIRDEIYSPKVVLGIYREMASMPLQSYNNLIFFTYTISKTACVDSVIIL